VLALSKPLNKSVEYIKCLKQIVKKKKKRREEKKKERE
jgi:hypothetical protein